MPLLHSPPWTKLPLPAVSHKGDVQLNVAMTMTCMLCRFGDDQALSLHEVMAFLCSCELLATIPYTLTGLFVQVMARQTRRSPGEEDSRSWLPVTLWHRPVMRQKQWK